MKIAPLPRALLLPIVATPIMLTQVLLFRRGRKATRADAFQELFDILANVYQRAADLKNAWQVDWRRRAERPLPPKYAFDNTSAAAAAADMRFGTALLQQNRWKSLVEPLFTDIDRNDWDRYAAGVQVTSAALLGILERHEELLQGDERDWISAAIEQFDEAARRSSVTDKVLERRVAETTYAYVYAAIALSDRLIERLRFEASQRR